MWDNMFHTQLDEDGGFSSRQS